MREGERGQRHSGGEGSGAFVGPTLTETSRSSGEKKKRETAVHSRWDEWIYRFINNGSGGGFT